MLAWPPLVRLGRVSDSFYLLRWMIVVLVARPVALHSAAWSMSPSILVILGGGFVLSAAVATLSSWLAERPYFGWVRGRTFSRT